MAIDKGFLINKTLGVSFVLLLKSIEKVIRDN